MITYKMSESTANIEMNVSEVTVDPEVTAVVPEVTAAPEIKLNEVGVNVTLEFLVNVRNILEVCTARSAWKMNELSSIGRLYDSINEVIKNKVTEIKPPTEAPGLTTISE